MDWLKGLIAHLPLEAFSELLGQIVLWWIGATKDINEADLPVLAYVGGSVLVLFVLYFGLKIFPKTIAGAIWLISAAILLTPGSTIGKSDGVAPAIVGVAHSVLMGEAEVAWTLFLPILATMIVLLVLGALWQLLKSIILDFIEHKKATKKIS